MTKELVRYRRLERRLWFTRWRNDGEDSPEENEILDEMDAVWIALSEDEQALLKAEGPRCWPLDFLALPPQFLDARYVAEPGVWAYEGFQSPLAAIASTDAS